MSNYYEQSDIAERLQALAYAVAAADRQRLDELCAEAQNAHRDFLTHVVAKILGIDYFDVMPLERRAVKDGLFVYLYSAPVDRVFRIQDAVIIERGPR